MSQQQQHSFVPQGPEEVAMSEALAKLTSQATTKEVKETMEREMVSFMTLFHRFLDIRKAHSEHVDWATIRPPTADAILQHSALPVPTDAAEVKRLLSKLVVLKLNGGLGTTMGCTGPKSVMEVQGGMTFLDLIVEQLRVLNKTHPGVAVPLVLMDSFNTHSDTLKAIEKYKATAPEVAVLTFMQSRHPRFDAATLLPLAKSLQGNDDAFYPPGHADVYQCFSDCGLLDSLMKQGKEYVFVANADNLGALVDLAILSHMDKSGLDFMMEVTAKTMADVKGGTLVQQTTADGKMKLLELAQVPPAHLRDFESVSTFKIFNTNNLWIRMASIAKAVAANPAKSLDIIVNKKGYGGGNTLIQLEIAAGAAVSLFEKVAGVQVPRSRFLPVKSTNDMLLLQSDLHVVQDGAVVTSPQRIKLYGDMPLPSIRLGPAFKSVGDYQKRFKGVPSLLDLNSLVVSGDVVFGTNVVLKGSVVILAPPGSHIDIPNNSVIDNKVVQGSLLITDL